MIANTTDDFYKIVTEDIPLIDVRAPIEFEKGAFLNSVNLPLMNDEERHLVGICYIEKGNAAAVNLGHELVDGVIRKSRIEGWTTFMATHPHSIIYCSRGGQRSQISQQWILNTTGKEVTRIEGGYKAFRAYLLKAFDPCFQKSAPIMLGGYTGSGKTILLKQLENAIDLEGIACHRGSTFGHLLAPQPSQINFENNLAYALIKHQHQGFPYMVFEDESRNIGKNYIPQLFYDYMQSGSLIVLEVPLEERIECIVKEYVILSQQQYIKLFGNNQGLSEWFNSICESMIKIKKSLGGELSKRILDFCKQAYENQLNTGSYDLHQEWVRPLLTEYYDKMYQHSLQKRNNRIIFKGSPAEVLEFLRI